MHHLDRSCVIVGKFLKYYVPQHRDGWDLAWFGVDIVVHAVDVFGHIVQHVG